MSADLYKHIDGSVQVRHVGISNKKVTWCFTPSQPVWLYQGDWTFKKYVNRSV